MGTAWRVLQKVRALMNALEENSKRGIEVPFLKQFGVYSDPERDKRGQIISVSYVAVHPSGKLRLKATTDVVDVQWFVMNFYQR